MDTFAPNLDGLDPDALMDFWRTHQRGRQARKLFPAGGRGTRRATRDLANYAANKATAMGLRLEGDIRTATTYEDICEKIYARLPAFARW